VIKPTVVVAVACLVLLGISGLAGAAKDPAAAVKSRPTVVAVLGPKVDVPPGRFVRAYARCPAGYYVTGGGAYSGAITEIISSPMTDLRGWFVDGTNTSTVKRTFQERADAVCTKGGPAITLGTAGAARTFQRQAELDFAAGHGAPRTR
jgi:hypothetical protein